jgi:cell division protein FtsW
LILIWRGIRIAVTAPDLFGSMLAAGIISMITIQVCINIAVVTGSMPPTGLPLPFISYGGSSLAMYMTGIGVLLNISRYAKAA